MWNDQAEDLLRELVQAWIAGDDEAMTTAIVEAELHELVEVHRAFNSITTQAFEELEHRHRYDQKTASGDGDDREYVERLFS